MVWVNFVEVINWLVGAGELPEYRRIEVATDRGEVRQGASRKAESV